MALWSGRFEEGVSEFTQEFGASLPVDKAMYKQDIAGSMAHARMLADQGVISHEDAEAITAGLAQIERDIEEGNFIFDINNEDIHMSIESELTRRIGEAGKRCSPSASALRARVCTPAALETIRSSPIRVSMRKSFAVN